MNKNIENRCKNIKILLTDVDGVLTDGGMYYSSEGDIMKKFHVRDGMGVNLLRRNNILTIIVTKEKTKIVRQWAKNMNVEKIYDGVKQKKQIIDIVCKTFKVKVEEMAYIGDDVNDLELMKYVGFSATPNDGTKEAKQIADYTCKVRSGDGVLREIADLILSIRYHDKKKLY